MRLIGLVRWRLKVDSWFLAIVIGDFACHLWPWQEKFSWNSEDEKLFGVYLRKNRKRGIGDFKCRQLLKEFSVKRNKESIQCGKWKQEIGFLKMEKKSIIICWSKWFRKLISQERVGKLSRAIEWDLVFQMKCLDSDRSMDNTCRNVQKEMNAKAGR